MGGKGSGRGEKILNTITERLEIHHTPKHARLLEYWRSLFFKLVDQVRNLMPKTQTALFKACRWALQIKWILAGVA